MRNLFSWITLCALLSGCSSLPESPGIPTQRIVETNMPASATPEATMPEPSPSVLTTTTPAPPQTAEAGTAIPPTPAASCVTLSYEDNAQVELISSQGRRVMVDVYDPNLLSSPAAEEDVLLTTHTHWDHINADFLKSFPGQQLFTRAGSLHSGDISIQGIASVHNAGDAFKPEGGTNYLYLILMDGLRIAHFGDIGQKILTAEQLEALGLVDVAITQFANPYSDMSAENRKGFHLMEQVQPRLIIPTHINLDAAKMAAAQWQGLYSDHISVQICPTRLTEQTQILFLGDNAEQFGTRLNMLEIDW